jgi:hypothetical protein
LGEACKTRTPQERSSDATGKIYDLRCTYFDAIADAREKGELTGDEYLFEMMRLSEMTAGQLPPRNYRKALFTY